MAGLLVEWQVTDSGWVQITHDAERADTGLLNFAVDDLPQPLAELTARGLTPGEIIRANRHHSGQQRGTAVNVERSRRQDDYLHRRLPGGVLASLALTVATP
jgi:hypothetical protein